MIEEKSRLIIKEKENKEQNDFLKTVTGSWEDMPK